MKDDGTPTAACVNHWTLTAQLVEVAALRFSPAGIPAIDCVLEHQSDVVEAGLLRKVQVRLKAVAVGPVAEQLGRQPLGVQARFEGFLGGSARFRHSTGRNTSVVFHVQSFVTG